MGKNYLAYGAVSVLISFLLCMAVGSLKVYGINSNKIKSSIDEEVNRIDTKEDSIINKEDSISNELKGQEEIHDSDIWYKVYWEDLKVKTLL